MTPLVPLFLSQRVSERSQVKRWRTAGPARSPRRSRLVLGSGRSRVSRLSGRLAVAAASLWPNRRRLRGGRRLVPVQLDRPVGAPSPIAPEGERAREAVSLGRAAPR